MSKSPNYVFPADDLCDDLVDIYFKQVNPFLPLLHRPTFERHMNECLHLRDHDFAGVLLLVCAVASRYCNDSRVFLDSTNDPHCAGWKFFEQVQLIPQTLLRTPNLFHLQHQCVRTTSIPFSFAF